MALSDDQKAMLRLLAQREQGYEDLASLMGLSVEEVRAQVKDALAELESDAPARAEQPKAKLEPSEPKAPAPAPKPSTPRSRPKLTLPDDRRLRIGGVAAGVAVLTFVVLLIAGVFGGGDDNGSSGSSPTAGGNATSASANSRLAGLTRAVLSPTDGSDARGRALFGRVRKNVVLQVVAQGLQPSPAGSSYTIWLYKSPQIALRIGAVKVGKPGVLDAQLPVPLELLSYVSSGGFDQLDIALTSDAAYEAEVASARQEKRLPAYTGTGVLHGRIVGPLTNRAANRG
ncbi:MAG TPA: hypothetical protein VF176_09820 [Solirubrobacterales bacterium]